MILHMGLLSDCIFDFFMGRSKSNFSRTRPKWKAFDYASFRWGPQGNFHLVCELPLFSSGVPFRIFRDFVKFWKFTIRWRIWHLLHFDKLGTQVGSRPQEFSKQQAQDRCASLGLRISSWKHRALLLASLQVAGQLEKYKNLDSPLYALSKWSYNLFRVTRTSCLGFCRKSFFFKFWPLPKIQEGDQIQLSEAGKRKLKENEEGQFFMDSVAKCSKNKITDSAVLHFDTIYKRGNVKNRKKRRDSEKRFLRISRLVLRSGESCRPREGSKGFNLPDNNE